MGKSKSINFKAVSFQRGKKKTVQRSRDMQEGYSYISRPKIQGWEERKQPSLEKIVKEAADSVESPVCIK